MKSVIYTVFDKVAEEYGPLFEAKNDGVALRQFKQLLNTVVVENRDDYVLYSCGTFDHDAGVMVTDWEVVAHAGDFDDKEQKNV